MEPSEKVLFFLNLTAFAIVMLLFLFVSACFTLNLGKPPAWMIRILNKGIPWIKDAQSSSRLDKDFNYKWLPLPYSVSYGFLVAIISGLVIAPRILSSNKFSFFTFNMFMICFIIAQAFFGLALWLHLKVNSRRKSKYELFACGLMMLYIGYSFLIEMKPSLHSEWQYRALSDITENFAAEFAGNLSGPAVWTVIGFGIFALLKRFTKRKSFKPSGPSRVVRLVYKCRMILNPGFWLTLTICTWGMSDLPLARSYAAMGFLLLPLRYIVMGRMLKKPIIYLRSFAYAQAPVILGKVIMPATKSLAPVLALSHELQSADRVYNRVNPMENIHLAGLAETEWRGWIESQFLHSVAIIIDCTLRTQGVIWELEEALRVVPRAQIVILQSERTLGIPTHNVKVITYGSDWKSRRKAKKELKKYLKALFSSKPLLNIGYSA